MSSGTASSDKRVLERELMRGILNRSDIQNQIDELPDLAHCCDKMTIRYEGRPVSASGHGGEEE